MAKTRFFKLQHNCFDLLEKNDFYLSKERFQFAKKMFFICLQKIVFQRKHFNLKKNCFSSQFVKNCVPICGERNFSLQMRIFHGADKIKKDCHFLTDNFQFPKGDFQLAKRAFNLQKKFNIRNRSIFNRLDLFKELSFCKKDFKFANLHLAKYGFVNKIKIGKEKVF